MNENNNYTSQLYSELNYGGQPYASQSHSTQGQGYPGQLYAGPQDSNSPRPKKKRSGFFKGFLAGGLCAGLIMCLLVGCAGAYVYYINKELVDMGFSATKLAYMISYIQTYYYEDVDDSTLIEGIYDGLMASLGDTYAAYYTAEEYAEATQDSEGTYGGLGAVLTKYADTGEVVVVTVYADSPAEEAGLQTGDIIVSVDGIVGAEIELDAFVQNIRGEVGTSISMIYERDGVEYEVEITRAIISVPSIAYEMLTDEIGYIYISEFNANTTEQFAAAIEDLQAQGMQAVIYDLRYNSGGLLNTAVDMLDLILPGGTTVYMEYKDGERIYYTSDDETYLDIPTVVLVSEYTASASEIFAGAIRDFEWGTIIGTTTFGKGIVQYTMPLYDGSAIKLTVAYYFTPSGECIHGYGIDPDIELEYEFLGGEDDVYDESLDNQILKGIEVLEGELGIN